MLRAPVNVILVHVLCGCVIRATTVAAGACVSNSTAAWEMRVAAVRSAILAKLGFSSLLPVAANSTQVEYASPMLLAAYEAAVASSKRKALSDAQTCGGESLFAKTILFYVPVSYSLTVPTSNAAQKGTFRRAYY